MDLTKVLDSPLELEPAPARADAALADAQINGQPLEVDRGPITRVLHDGRRYTLFFICGHGKSGTNWVGNLLKLHPHIHVKGEFHFEFLWAGLEHLLSLPHAMPSVEPYRSLTVSMMEDVVRRLVLEIRHEAPNARCLGEQSPRRLVALVPGAPLFYVMRDGRDVLISLTYHFLRANNPEEVEEPLRPFYLEQAARFHEHPSNCRAAAEAMLAHEPFVRWAAGRWAQRLTVDLESHERLQAPDAPARSHLVRYEDLHADTERQRTRLYLALDLDPAIAYPLRIGTRPGAPVENPNRSLRKGEVGDWQNYASDNFRRWFKEEAGELLIRLGYARDMDW